MHRNQKPRRFSRDRIESLERRFLLTATLGIDSTSHALSYVDTPGLSNNLTVEVIAGATPMLQFTEANGFDSITLNTAAMNLGWVAVSPGVVSGPESSVSSMLIDTNDSDDTTIIKSSDVPVTIDPTNGSSSDEVDLGGANGDKGFSEAITAQVTIKNPSGATSVVVNDAGDAIARQVAVSDTGISGLTAVPIVYDSKTTSVQMNTGDVANTIDLTNASASKLFNFEDGADDTVNIHSLASTSTALVDGINGGHVSVNITNNGSLVGIKGTITLSSADLFPTVTVNGSADSAPMNVTIGDDGTITGLTAMPIQIGASIVTNLVIDAGTGGNTIDFDRENGAINPIPDNVTINSGTGNDTVYVAQNRGTSVTVNGQSGTDTVKLGVTPTSAAGTGSMTAFFGTTTITNSAGSTTIDVDDSSESFSHTINISDSGITGLTTTPITYSNASSVSVIGEQLADGFNVTPSAVTAFSVDGGPFTTAPADTLFVDTTSALSPVLNEQASASGVSGTYTFSNRKTVTFSRFGSVLGGVTGKVFTLLTGAPLPNTQVFLDLNHDGTLDPNDPVATTDSLGNYTFRDVIAGDFQVVQAPPSGAGQVAAAPASVIVTAGQIVAAPFIADAPQPVASGPDLQATLSAPAGLSIIGGAKGKVKLKITNAGTMTLTGTPQIALFASTNAGLDPSATSIGTVSAGKLKLKPGASKTISVRITYPKSISTGGYYVVASADSTDVIAETNKTNNIATSSTTVQIAAPFVDLTGKFGKLPKLLKAGKSATLPLIVQNLGNSIAAGLIDVTIYSSPNQDPNSDTVLSSDGSIPIKIKVHGFHLVSLHIPPGKTIAGSEFLIATINSSQSVAESDFSNNTVASPTAVTIV